MSRRHICLLFNPSSGRGRATASADRLAIAFDALGCSTSLIRVGVNQPPLTSAPLSGADAVVVIGGDGTVHRSLAAVLDAGAALYHFPHGTENLFARHFGMLRDPNEVARAVANSGSNPMDIISVTSDEFASGQPPGLAAIMVSVGPDASVIHRLSAARTGPIRHLTYAKPILAEFFRPSLPALTITVDGRPLVTNRPGMVVVANAPTYARYINPAHSALSNDGLLDVTFLPARTSFTAAFWLAACRLRVQHTFGAPAALGKVVRIQSSSRFAWQADGEAAGHAKSLEISIDPRPLRVVSPAI